jgi:hypothetical protein
MTTHSAEEVNENKIESFYIFLDTNLFYSPKITYNIFKIKLMEDILSLRNSFNKMFSGFRNIKILIPQLVVEETYSIKANIIKSEFIKFQEHIKHLEERDLKNSLIRISEEMLEFRLDSSGERFFSDNKIEIVPYCHYKYFHAIIQKSIKKQLPFKPKYDEKKNRYVGDDGFKDTVIWFSIIDYVKKNCSPNTDHVFFFTNNKKDFMSELTLLEFKILTGMDIEIIDFKSNNPNINDSEFTPFLNYILDKSHFPIPVKINKINISYLKLKNKAEMNSIFVEPLSINIISLVNCEKKFPNFGEENKLFLNGKIKDTLLKFRFDVSDLEFNYYIPEIESVYFTIVNHADESLVVGDIIIAYKDGFEKHGIDLELLEFYKNPETEYPLEFPIDYEGNSEKFNSLALKALIDYLEGDGFGNVSPEAIEFDYHYVDPW